MEQCKGLIAGIDIGYSKIQASVYSYNSRNVQTVKLTEDSKEKREKEDVLKMRDFRKERKPEIKIHTKEVRKKTF